MQEECQTNCDGPRQVGKQVPWDVAPKQKERVLHELVSGENATVVQLPSRLICVLPPQEQRMYITVADVNKFGPTDGCPGCSCFYGWTCVRRFLTTISKKVVLLNCCSSKNLDERSFESHRPKRRGAGEVAAEQGDKRS